MYLRLVNFEYIISTRIFNQLNPAKSVRSQNSISHLFHLIEVLQAIVAVYTENMHHT